MTLKSYCDTQKLRGVIIPKQVQFPYFSAFRFSTGMSGQRFHFYQLIKCIFETRQNDYEGPQPVFKIDASYPSNEGNCLLKQMMTNMSAGAMH